MRIPGIGKRRPGARQAIHLQDQRLHWALLDDLRQTPKVRHCASLPHPGDLGAALGELAREHDASRIPLVAVLSPGEYQLLLLEAPAVPRKELREAMRWQIRDLIDYPAEEAVIDVFDAPDSAARARPQVYTVVTHRRRIDRLAALAEDAGLRLEAVDIPELALRNLAVRLPEAETGLTLACLLEGVALIALVRGEMLHLARSIEIESLGGDMQPGAAETLTDTLALEIQRTLDYHARHFREGSFPHLVLAWQTQPVPDLLQRLQERIGLQGSELDPCALLRCVEGAEKGAPACLLAVAAALRPGESTRG